MSIHIQFLTIILKKIKYVRTYIKNNNTKMAPINDYVLNGFGGFEDAGEFDIASYQDLTEDFLPQFPMLRGVTEYWLDNRHAMPDNIMEIVSDEYGTSICISISRVIARSRETLNCRIEVYIADNPRNM